jgi:hypothetical protein
MLSRQIYLEVTIRSSPPYPRSGGASSAGEGAWSHVSDMSPRILSFCVCWCGFKSFSSRSKVVPLAMVVALLRWFVGA